MPLSITLMNDSAEDCGLSVTLSNHNVTIRRFCPAGTGGVSVPHIRVGIVSMSELFNPNAAHRCHLPSTPNPRSQTDKVIGAAIDYLDYWGGRIDRLQDGAIPSDFFGNTDSRIS